MESHKIAVVTGAGGFIGGHLVAEFRRKGYKHVRAVDVKPLDEWYQRFDDVENLCLDLNSKKTAIQPPKAPMRSTISRPHGRHGLHRDNKALCMLSVLINTHMLRPRRTAVPEVFLFLVGLRL